MSASPEEIALGILRAIEDHPETIELGLKAVDDAMQPSRVTARQVRRDARLDRRLRRQAASLARKAMRKMGRRSKAERRLEELLKRERAVFHRLRVIVREQQLDRLDAWLDAYEAS